MGEGASVDGSVPGGKHMQRMPGESSSSTRCTCCTYLGMVLKRLMSRRLFESWYEHRKPRPLLFLLVSSSRRTLCTGLLLDFVA
uniref:Uncharacterized protein n=1 Tax=Ixodes ricinus TaxID=34613 RepID=A0A6B0U8M2_IXORI